MTGSKTKVKKQLAKAKTEILRLKSYIAHEMRLRPREAKIQMEIPNSHQVVYQSGGFSIYSAPIELAGFQWKLRACAKKPGFLGLFLRACPPKDFASFYRFELHTKFSVINQTNEAGTIEIIMDNQCVMRGMCECGDDEVMRLQDFTFKPNDFVSEHGLAQVEVHFKICDGTLGHFMRHQLLEEGDSSSEESGSSSDVDSINSSASNHGDNKENFGNGQSVQPIDV